MNKQLAYKILGLTEGVSEQEIRRRYKKLAMKVHPDINPDQNAHEEFILLSLAVEFLLKPQEEQLASRTSRSTSKKEETSEEHLARMNEAKMRFEDQKRKNTEENVRYFNSLISGKRWGVYKIITLIGVVLATSLILDNFLPQHMQEDTIESYSSGTHNGILEERICQIHFTQTGACFVKSNNAAWTTGYPDVTVVKTWILHNPISFYSSDDFINYNTGFDFDMRSIQWLMVLLFLIPLYPYLYKRMSLRFVFLYQFSFWAVGLVELIVLVSQNRFLHILSLGFL